MRIIEALSDLVYYYQEISAAEYGEIELSEPKRLEIDEYWRRGNLAVRKATNVGSFLISAEAEEALKQYWRPPAEKHDPNDWIRELDHKFRAADICLKELVECAKRDLGVETTRLGRRRTPRA
jgi:hypothetical protein